MSLCSLFMMGWHLFVMYLCLLLAHRCLFVVLWCVFGANVSLCDISCHFFLASLWLFQQSRHIDTLAQRPSDLSRP